MKLLLFSDLHADAAAARRLAEQAHAADVLTCRHGKPRQSALPERGS